MAKLKLITEYYDKPTITEGKTGDVYIEGIFSSANLKNKNGRTYKKATLEREIGKLQENVKNKRLWLELGHPNSPDINLERIAAIAESLEWDGDNVIGRAKLLDTPMGKIAKNLVKEGSIGISSRGLGTVNENGMVNDENYQLITFDIVSNPSNQPSWVNGIYEGKTFDVSENNEEKVLTEKEKKKLTTELKKEIKKLFD